jgi:ATP-dependent Clp protease ATP-binding subunit ClpA
MFERFTDRARRVVVLAQEEAMMLNHNYIGTEHILLGLIREGDGVAAQVLVKLGADLNQVRQQVIQLLHGSSKRASPPLPDDALARSTHWTVVWQRSNAGQACDLTWASWIRRSRRCVGRRKPRSTGRISRPPL